MPDNFETLWLQPLANQQARTRAIEAILQTGRALPCSVVAVNGPLVTVKFEVTSIYTLPNLTLPKNESQWCRTPTQVGDVGITAPADTYLGGISGQGTGTADLALEYGNLTTLVFTPITQTSFSDAPDPNKFWGNGPNGVRIGDAQNQNYVDIDANSGTFTVILGGQTVLSIDANSGTLSIGGQTWTFAAAGFTMSTGVIAETHIHPGVTTGSGVTGEPEA